MAATDRHACPDCGASHQRRQPKTPTRTTAANTDLKPGRCTCGQPVIRGRIDGLDYALDAQPINELAFITYRHAGRRTFRRKGVRAHPDTYASTWVPDARVHIAHDCTNPIPAAFHGDTVTFKAAAPRVWPDTPPF